MAAAISVLPCRTCNYTHTLLGCAIDQLPSDRQLGAALSQAGLRILVTEPWFVPDDPVDLFLYAGKRNPALYLDERVRKDISTFASLADSDEIESGLACLRPTSHREKFLG